MQEQEEENKESKVIGVADSGDKVESTSAACTSANVAPAVSPATLTTSVTTTITTTTSTAAAAAAVVGK
jgi:hypothetical protein